MNTDNQLPEEPVIIAYTRKEALEDGVQIDVSKLAAEAGIRVPVYLTHALYVQYVTVPVGVIAQDETGRLWDILTMLRYAMSKAQSGATCLTFALYIRNDNRSSQLVSLVAECGALDIDDPRPAITVALRDED